MTDNRFAVPLTELERATRVAATSQVQGQAEPGLVQAPATGLPAHGDGAAPDADGE